MNAQGNAVLICPKGHGRPSMPGSFFCNACGERLIPEAQQNHAAKQAPPAHPGQFQNGNLQAPPPAMQNQPLAYPPQANGYYPQPQGIAPAQNFAPVQQYAPAPFNRQMAGQGQPLVMQNPAKAYCNRCGGGGVRLAATVLVCSQCRWLRPLAPNYRIGSEAFMWAQDGAAMSKLRSISSLNTVARTISDKVGRRWVESTFNAIRLSETQLPEVYAPAVHAARILGMPYMPDVYISGDRMWDALIFGSDDNAFLVLGTALISNFRGEDLLFVLAREMGHCRAGHALWKTVIRFLVGEMAPRGGLMAGGLFSAVGKVLSPSHLIESAIELPLLAWARQAEITADRAGLLAVGDEAIARRVLLSWSLKSSMLCQRINIDAWLSQEEDDDQVMQLSEMLSSSTPYLTRRLKLIQQFTGEPQMQYWRNVIKSLSPAAKTVAPAVALPGGTPRPAPQPNAIQAAATPPAQQQPPKNAQPIAAKPAGKALDDSLKLSCGNCKTAMRIPKSALAGKAALNVRCPNAACGKVITLKKQAAKAPPQKPLETLKQEAAMSFDD
jgi:Zn-dependent protease with chaperone function